MVTSTHLDDVRSKLHLFFEKEFGSKKDIPIECVISTSLFKISSITTAIMREFFSKTSTAGHRVRVMPRANIVSLESKLVSVLYWTMLTLDVLRLRSPELSEVEKLQKRFPNEVLVDGVLASLSIQCSLYGVAESFFASPSDMEGVCENLFMVIASVDMLCKRTGTTLVKLISTRDA